MAKRPVRSDLQAVVEYLPKRDRPGRLSMENVSEAMEQAFGPDDSVRAFARGGLKPAVSWILGGQKFLRVEETITGKWGANAYELSLLGEMAMEPADAAGGWYLYWLSPDGGEPLDRLRLATRETALAFGEARRRQTKPSLVELVGSLDFDCFHPPSELQGASAASDLQMGNEYELAFAANAVVVGDDFGPVLMFSEEDVIDLEISGREDVYNESQFETNLVLRTEKASIFLVNRFMLPQEARARLMPETQRISRRKAVPMPARGSSAGGSLADELSKLAALREAGHLDDREYAAAKQRLLDSAS